MLCTQVLNGLVSALGVLNFEAGREFDVVAVSFNPKEGPGLASQKKAAYVERYGRPQAAGGWHFLTGSQESITRLTEAVGFQYAVRPEDRPVRPRRGHRGPDAARARSRSTSTASNTRRAISGSASSRPRTSTSARSIDDVLLFCYHYDPSTGKYGADILALVRTGAVATVLAFAVFLTVSLRRDAPARGSQNLTMFTNLPFFPQQASAQAAQVDAIYFFMVAVTAFFSLLIAALVVVFAVKYRRKSDDEIGVAIHGSLALELMWTFIPLGIAMVMFAWGAKVFFDLYRPPAGAMEIFVVGKQWMWKAQHADGQREINELHVPIGRPVKLVMGSEDVIHSYYIPAFRVKADVIPGRYNSLWFTATKPGPLPPVLRRVLRHQALGDDRLDHGDGAGRLSGLAGGRAGDRRRRSPPARSSSRIWRATPATSRARRAAGRCSPDSSARRSSCRAAGPRSSTRRISASRS